MERNADYAEELAKLQRQEYEAKDATARYGYLFSQATAEILCQAEAEIQNQGVSAYTIHPQSQILGDLASPVMTRSKAQKSKFGESAFIGYIQDQQRTNHTDQL
ncbi:hypothetical protein Tco_0423478 [Tanacetum coccineum]